MKIRYRLDGGFAAFPGLAKPQDIDVDGLPADAAARLRAAVDRSAFFTRAAPAAAASRAADMRRYEVTIDDGDRTRTLTIPETTDDPSLKGLVAALEAQRRSASR